MHHLVKVISFEGELGIIIPSEFLKYLNVSVSDSVDLTETDHGFTITRRDFKIHPLEQSE
jgi:hypothetical protein